MDLCAERPQNGDTATTLSSIYAEQHPFTMAARKERPQSTIASGNARSYNHDLLAGINTLKEKRDEIDVQIEDETMLLNKLNEEIAVLNEKLQVDTITLESNATKSPSH